MKQLKTLLGLCGFILFATVSAFSQSGLTDSQFQIGTGADNGVFSMKLQSDGKVLVGGDFSNFNGTPRASLVRLNEDGSIDPSFPNSLSAASLRILSIDIDSTGKILVGGELFGGNGATVFRLNSNGAIDTSFNQPMTSNGAVYAVSIQPDGKIVIGGEFTTVNGTSVNRIARLNNDGTLDTGFSSGLSGVDSRVLKTMIQPDGKILLCGNFSVVNGISRRFLARLNSNGTLDTSFGNGQSGVNQSVSAISLQNDGKILIGGDFTAVNGVSRNRLARLFPDGTLDTVFLPPPLTGVSGNPAFINSILVQSDGKVVIGGGFSTVNSVARNNVARLTGSGSQDTAFGNGQSGTNGSITAMALQPDGKSLIGGFFSLVNGSDRRGIARLTSPCSITLPTSFANASQGGGPGTIEVLASGTTCPWTAVSNNFFITITSGATGTGNGTVGYSVAANNGIQRVGTVTIAGQTFTVTQSNGCTYSINPTNANAAAAGGSGTLAVTASDTACPWTAVSNNFFITITSGATGTGNGSVGYSVAANTGAQRNGTLTIAGQTFTVTQAAVDCTYTVSPQTIPLAVIGGTTTVTVTAPTGCTWTAVSNSPFISVTSGASGSGNGTVQISVNYNPGIPRSGTLTIAGQTVTISQPAKNASTPGQFRPSNGFVYIKNTNETGFADREFFYGTAGDVPVSGDWDGNGTDTIGIYRNGTFFLRNSNTSGFADIQFPFGSSGDIPIVGDWDGDGIDTVGIVRGNTIFLKNSNTAGNADIQFAYGTSTDIFITGDWNGDGIDTIGCFRPTNGFVYIRNTNTTGIADFEFFYGQAGDKPVVGDWNGDGIDTIGIVRGNQWFLRNSNTSGFAEIQYFYGTDTDVPITGDWDGI